MLQKMTSITEEALLYHIECPLHPDGSSGPVSPVLRCAENIARWLIDEIAAGRQPTEDETHEFFRVQWQQTGFYQSRDANPLEDYSHLVEEGVLACSRVRDLIRPCQILQPVSPYALSIDGITITGEYAVLHSRHLKVKTLIPYFEYQRVKPRRVVPDVVTCARSMDASNRLPFGPISIMHWFVNQNLSAVFQPVYAGLALHRALGVITDHPYPRFGKHCETCPTRDCRAAIQEFPR